MANCNKQSSTWPKQILPHPPTPSVLCTAPKAVDVIVVKSLKKSRSRYIRACPRHFLFPVPNCQAEFLAFLCSSPPFFSLEDPPPGCFSREIKHMQVGQCGNQMGTE